MARKPDAFYKQMVRTLRHGFVDAERTDTLIVTPGTVKTTAIRDLRNAGYVIGKETEYNTRTGEVTDVRRTGKIARGFAAADGFNMRDIDSWSPAMKARVTRIFKTVQKLSAQPYQEFRTPKRENLERVQDASHGIKTPDELVLAFVPVARPGERAQIKILDDRIEVIEREVKRTPTMWGDVINPETGKKFSLKNVADDPIAAIRAMVEFTGGDRFQFMSVNAPMFGLAYDASALEGEMRRLLKDYKKRWRTFLTGIQAFTAPTAEKIRQYRVSKDTSKRAQKKERQRAATVFRRKIRMEEKRRKIRAKKRRGKWR